MVEQECRAKPYFQFIGGLALIPVFLCVHEMRNSGGAADAALLLAVFDAEVSGLIELSYLNPELAIQQVAPSQRSVDK